MGVTLALPDSITTPPLVPDEGQGDPFCHLTAEPREPGLRGAGQEMDPTDGWDTCQERRLVACEARRLGGQSQQHQAGMSGTSKMSGQALHAWSLVVPVSRLCTAAQCAALHDMSSTHVLVRNKIYFRRLLPDRLHSQPRSRGVKSHRHHLPRPSRKRHQV